MIMWMEQTIETTRGTFQYFTAGEGAPVAVTHHYSEFDERGNLFAAHFTEHFKVYLINLRGVGKSVLASKDDEYSFEQTVLDLEAIREALGYETWGFGGHSTGGMLALQYAIQAQQSLSFIVAGGASASYEYSMSEKSIYNHKNPDFARVREIMNSLSMPETPVEERRKLGYEWTLKSFVSEDKLKEMLKKPNSGKTVGNRLTYFREVEYQQMDFRPHLHKVQIPSYIYAGRFDSQCPVEFGIEIAEHIPNAKLTIFEQSNHFPFVEEEELFAEMITTAYKEQLQNV